MVIWTGKDLDVPVEVPDPAPPICEQTDGPEDNSSRPLQREATARADGLRSLDPARDGALLLDGLGQSA